MILPPNAPDELSPAREGHLRRHLIAVAEHTPSPRRERDHALALV